MTEQQFNAEAQMARGVFVSIARRYTGNDSDADDAVQDVMMRLWDLHSDIRNSMLPLGRVLTRNIAIDLVRRRRHSEDIDQAYRIEEDADDDSYIRLERIMAMVDQLPQREQTAFRLRHIDQMTMAEIAQLMDSNETAVRQLLSRARRSLLLNYNKMKQ